MSMTMLDLPTETVAHIFSFVSHKKDRRNLALICKQFYNIVRQQSKKHNRLKLRHKENSSLSFFEQSDEFPFHKIQLQSKDIEQYRGLWQKHGAEITEMTFYCIFEDMCTFGSDFKELFPNLKALFWTVDHLDLQSHRLDRQLTSTGVKNVFSENIKYLELDGADDEWKQFGSILEHFPGVKHLKLEISIFGQLNDSEVQEFMDFLDKWLPQLEIKLSLWEIEHYQLLEVFKGLIDKKLSFENLTVILNQRSINVLKGFFSVTRHVKSLEFYDRETVPDSTFCALIEKNAKIDSLSIEDVKEGNLAKLRYLINAPGVKEIAIIEAISLGDCLYFTPEALLKVIDITVHIHQEESVMSIPKFRNLRNLYLLGPNIGDEELAFIVNNFPHLEVLLVPGLVSTNGHLLAHLKRLRELEIQSSDAFLKFGTKFPNLETLRLTGVPKINLKAVKSIVANCPKIQEIEFDSCTKITKKCVDYIAQNLFYVDRIQAELEPNSRRFLEKKYPEVIFAYPCI